MDRSVAQALHGLLPTISGPLPPGLLDLATSLLAQSRSKASSLKADEEIARSYACANIACERLKQSLSLPQIEPRPPCPPKIYQKLYRYLDGALPASTKRNARAPRGSDHPSSSIKAVKPRVSTRPSATFVRRTERPSLVAEAEVPVWVMPIIRRLCAKLEAPAAPHHIYAGVSSVLASQSRFDKASKEQDPIKVSALIIVIFFLVFTRLTGIPTPSKQYVQQRGQALAMMKELVALDVEIGDVDNTDVDALMRQVGTKKWTEMDWFGNIQLGSGVGTSEDEADLAEDAFASDEEDEAPLIPGSKKAIRHLEDSEPGYLQPGLGTMMQDKVDYLSDERRREYQEWKADILLRIEDLEMAARQKADAGKS